MNTSQVNRVDAASLAASHADLKRRPETPTCRAPDCRAVPLLSLERARALRPVLAMPATGIRRRTLHSSGPGCVADFSAPGDYPAPCGHSPEYQLVLPYGGAFESHVGARTVFLDGTRVLFVSAGEDYADRHGAGGGHDSIIITPRLSMLRELCRPAVPSRHPAFQRVAESTTPRMSLRTHRLLRLEASDEDPLASDELMIALLGEALAPTESVADASSPRVVAAIRPPRNPIRSPRNRKRPKAAQVSL